MTRRPRERGARAVSLAIFVATCALPWGASAQTLECDGGDPAAAQAEGDAGTELLHRAVGEARSGGDLARSLAMEALARFDRQCELGDPRGLAGRGAALMLLGEPLQSAQSYDAFLRQRPLDTLDADERRRTEANLQPAEARIESGRVEGARLVIDGLDFGPLPRSSSVHLPEGPHRFEARTSEGAILAEAAADLTLDGAPARVELRPLASDEPAPDREEDLSAWYITTSVVAAGMLGVGIALLPVADERLRTYDAYCTIGRRVQGCEAVLAERDAAFAVSGAGFVLASLAAIGLSTVAIIDLGRPREPLRAWLQPEAGGASVALHCSF